MRFVDIQDLHLETWWSAAHRNSTRRRSLQKPAYFPEGMIHTRMNYSAFNINFCISGLLRQCRSGRTLGHPENAFTGPLIVISKKKYFDVMAHPQAEWPSPQKNLIFCFFSFHHFSVSPFWRNFGRIEKSSIGVLQGLKIYVLKI